MRRVFLILMLGCLTISLSACTRLQKIIKPKAEVTPVSDSQPLPPYSGPKVRIAVADFSVNAPKVTSEISSGLRQMMITALVNSNRFSIVEHRPIKAAVEQEIAGNDKGKEAGLRKDKYADLVITAIITEFQPQASGGRAGVGGGGGIGSGVLGALMGDSLNKAHIALDINLVDVTSSETIAFTRVRGEASDISGIIMTEFSGYWALGEGLSAYANTPMEKAIRICIIEAVKYIYAGLPEKYYKY